MSDVSVVITLQEEGNESCQESQSCIMHLSCPLKLLRRFLPKVITCFYFDNIKIDDPDEISIGDLMLKNPNGILCCKHCDKVCSIFLVSQRS